MSLDLLRAGSRRIPKLAARLSSGSGSALTERLVGEVQKLPKSLWPIIQAHWCQPKCFLSMAGHLESLPASAAACQAHLNLADLPLIVLSADDCSPARRAEHQAMADLSSRGRLIVAEGCGHWIQLDAPKLVVASILEVVNTQRVRTSSPVKV
jgi:pimeloyl-ACP methyl ester carboxylesterase